MTEDLMSQIYMVETPACSWCGNTGVVEIPFKSYISYFMDHQLIQDAMPEVAAPIREQIKTGYHPECWAKMFGGNE